MPPNSTTDLKAMSAPQTTTFGLTGVGRDLTPRSALDGGAPALPQSDTDLPVHLFKTSNSGTFPPASLSPGTSALL